MCTANYLYLFYLESSPAWKYPNFHVRYNLILKFFHICSKVRACDLYGVVINKGNWVFVFVDDTLDKIDIKKVVKY